MSHDPKELLSAFLDGESVQPTAVAEALATPDALETLRDFVLLRAEVRADESAPRPEAYRRMRAILEPVERKSWWRQALPVPAPLVAASVVAAVALAFWAGLVLRSPSGQPADLPPTPDRVIRFEPAPVMPEQSLALPGATEKEARS